MAMPLRCLLDVLDGEKTSGEAAQKTICFTNEVTRKNYSITFYRQPCMPPVCTTQIREPAGK